MAKFSTLFVLVIVLLLVACDMSSAKKQKLKKAKVKKVNKDNGLKKNLADKAEELKGGKDETDEDANGISMEKVYKRGKHMKMQQKYKKLKVWGYQVNHIDVEGGSESKFADKEDGGETVVNVAQQQLQSGKFVDSLSDDFPNVNHGQLNKLVNTAKRQLRKECKRLKITELTGEPIVYIDEDTGEGTLGAHVSMLCSEDDKVVKNPNAIFDDDGEMIKLWDDIRKDFEKIGTGAGGNLKTGRYVYGVDRPKFTVKNLGNGLCTTETEHIETYWWTLNYGLAPHKFACAAQQVADPINGAYSPLNDVHFAAETTLEMFQKWYKTVPFKKLPLKLRAHYYYPYFNAFHIANTEYYMFADGDATSFPLATLDIVAHELGHGVNEYGANLLYYGEMGGLNEAFSDMTAMAVTEYAALPTTWRIADVFKKAGDMPLRDMAEPTSDGKSIDHLDDYYPGMDVHYSSGLYNKVFYLMSQKLKYGVWDAYDVAFHSLINTWTLTTNFVEAAEGMLTTVDKMKDGSIKTPYTYSWLDTSELADIFSQVGIKCAEDAFGWICAKQ